ncbi:uncharacterized protein A1O9_04610 [Exophiala aquamarina CBS 119918]|uniref:TLC domain-containing protein n=1 Tax=Exophiala aquamarina CBS 119918 TaxID=1182545 RepID=A0A072PJ77_9EURO|nr:uncharacterized protein A1O9_04610 [Exophiala aquamarina CBS 119918]KEF59762.1 hypothetical protein A1O9_04610 [Exophiala aquamarina CBS 119918]
MFDASLRGFQEFVTTLCNNNRLTTLPLHAHQVVAAFLVYECIFTLLSPAISTTLFRNSYGRFPRRTRVNWDARVVSTIQATFVSFMALRVILGDGEARSTMSRDDRLWGYSPASGRVQAFAAGYFLWDVFLCVRHLEVQGVPALLHGVAALVITVTGFRPFANFYGINFVLYELSTPFLNIHWFLDKAGQTGTTIQLVNGICLIAAFFGCRLVWGNYQTLNLSLDAFEAWKASTGAECLAQKGPPRTGVPSPALCSTDFPTRLLTVYLIGNTILSALNAYWFGLMVKALRKRFTPSSASGKERGKEKEG